MFSDQNTYEPRKSARTEMRRSIVHMLFVQLLELREQAFEIWPTDEVLLQLYHRLEQ